MPTTTTTKNKQNKNRNVSSTIQCCTPIVKTATRKKKPPFCGNFTRLSHPCRLSAARFWEEQQVRGTGSAYARLFYLCYYNIVDFTQCTIHVNTMAVSTIITRARVRFVIFRHAKSVEHAERVLNNSAITVRTAQGFAEVLFETRES